MMASLAATSENPRERIQVRELASSHRLEQMRRLEMLKMQRALKKKADFDRIEIIADMHEQRLQTGFDSKPLSTGL